MKNIKYYLVIGLSAVFTACTDLLDIEPNNKITPNELFNNCLLYTSPSPRDRG